MDSVWVKKEAYKVGRIPVVGDMKTFFGGIYYG